MVNLSTRPMRYLSNEDFRVLTAVETASRNHEVVPVPLIAKISRVRAGAVQRSLGELMRYKLVQKPQNAAYDGVRLTYTGLDHLALKTFLNRETIFAVGNQIGVGKESDIYVVSDKTGKQSILKLHRLGRTSFRTVKTNRDYTKRGKENVSWLFLSRLAAEREHSYMCVLHAAGFPVPRPIDQSRHCVVMELIDAFPLRSIETVLQPDTLYAELMAIIVRFAEAGLIHSDFNEFNILVAEDGTPTIIDFPQMVSIDHENAEYYFDRDVQCIRTFFERKLRFVPDTWPTFASIERKGDLDRQVEASGAYSKRQLREFDSYLARANREAQEHGDEEEDEEDEEEEHEEEEEEEEEEEDEEEEHDEEEETEEDRELTAKTV